MMVEVRNQLRPLATEVGIEIVDVRIRRTDLLPEVSQQTFERMRAERLAEAAQLRARGTELAARIRAEVDYPAKCIATGGLAALIATETRTIEATDELLTLKGLKILYQRNQP